MKNLTILLTLVVSSSWMAAQTFGDAARKDAATPKAAATMASPAAAPVAPAPALPAGAVPASTPAAPGWYYLQAGWYLLVPATSAAALPGQPGQAQALPAGLGAPGAPAVYYVPVPASNVAPESWTHDHQNDNQWPADHGG